MKRSQERPQWRGALLTTITFLLTACGAPPPAITVPPFHVHPCTLSQGTLVVPVTATHALAVGEGGCLLIDESQHGTFVSFNEIGNTTEGDEGGGEEVAALPDLRTFLRNANVLGGTPRFVSRESRSLLGERVEVHGFLVDAEMDTDVAPSGRRDAPTRGLATWWPLPTDHTGHSPGQLLVLIFGDDDASLEGQWALLGHARWNPSRAN